MRFIVFSILFFSISYFAAHAQQDSLPVKRDIHRNQFRQPVNAPLSDSLIKANRENFVADSVALGYVFPDSLREDQFITGLLKHKIGDFASFSKEHLKNQRILSGLTRKQRDPWVIAAILGLIIYTALLNFFLNADIRSIFQSFYKKNIRSQVEKEGGAISIWAVIGLFILFCLTSGLVLYQLTLRSNVYYNIGGFQLFLSLSVLVALLFSLKYVVLKFIGFIFDINRIVNQYVGILNLTYFNIAFVLLFVAACFSLLNNQFLPLLLNFTWAVIAVIFAWQYLLNSVSIISNFRFHKFYLFIYLCALEICPILILIKALDI